MLDFRPSTPSDLPRVMDIWRAAVDATHDFLAPSDRAAIEAEVLEFFPQVSLLLAVDNSDAPLGFMFLHDGHLEALFVDPDHHGKGIGKALILNVLAVHGAAPPGRKAAAKSAIAATNRICMRSPQPWAGSRTPPGATLSRRTRVPIMTLSTAQLNRPAARFNGVRVGQRPASLA